METASALVSNAVLLLHRDWETLWISRLMHWMTRMLFKAKTTSLSLSLSDYLTCWITKFLFSSFFHLHCNRIAQLSGATSGRHGMGYWHRSLKSFNGKLWSVELLDLGECRAGHHLAVWCILLPRRFYCKYQEQSSHYPPVHHLNGNMDTFNGGILTQHVQELWGIFYIYVLPD